MPAVEGVNRIQEAIDRTDKALAEGKTTAMLLLKDTVDDTSFAELCRYQDIRAAAHAGGKLTLEEATQGYDILGGVSPSAGKWQARTLAERIVMTQLAWELECSMRPEDIPAKKRRK